MCTVPTQSELSKASKRGKKVAQKLFVPLTDDLMYDTPEMITSGLRPYRVDTPCYHWDVTIELAHQAAHQDQTQALRPNVIPFPQELAA